MADERTVEYTMRLVDNVSATKSTMAGAEKNYAQTVVQSTTAVAQENVATKQAVEGQTELSNTAQAASSNVQGVSASSKEAVASEGQLNASAVTTNNTMQTRQMNFMTQITMVRALHSSIMLTTNAFETLGLVNEDGIKTMRMFGAVVDLAVGAFQGLKGVTMLINQLRDAEIAEAAVASFRAVLANPLALGLVAAGAGAAAGVGAYMLTQPQHTSSQTTVNNQISFTAPVSSSDQRQTARAALTAYGG